MTASNPIQDPSLPQVAVELPPRDEETIRLEIPCSTGFHFHWLREVGPGVIEGDLGRCIGPLAGASARLTLTGRFRRVIAPDERGWIRLQLFRNCDLESSFAPRIAVAAEIRNPCFGQPDELACAILGLPSGQRLAEDSDPVALREAVRLKDSIYEKAGPALEKRLGAEAARLCQSAPADAALLDCGFALTEDGMRAYRRALGGEYSGVLTCESECIRLHESVLSHPPAWRTILELHLPFFGRKEWPGRREALAGLQADSAEDGRICVYRGERSGRADQKNSCQAFLALFAVLNTRGSRPGSTFTLSHTGTHRLPSRRMGTAVEPLFAGYGFDEQAGRWLDQQSEASSWEDARVSVSLSIPGSLTAAWLDSPDDNSPSFFPVYSRISLAVQRALRRWLPFLYFENLSRYDTTKTAFPMVIYQASRPYTPKLRTDFTYDVLNERHRSMFIGSSARGLRRELTRISRLLQTAGRTETASLYHPLQADDVLSEGRRRASLINALLAADTFFVDALIKLGCQAGRLRRQREDDPRAAAKNLMRTADHFVKTVHGRLRRLYAGVNFLPLGSLLLVEATNALNLCQNGGSAMQAVLRVAGREHVEERIFVNSAWRP